jgi:hypothetical protein
VLDQLLRTRSQIEANRIRNGQKVRYLKRDLRRLDDLEQSLRYWIESLG